MRTRSAFGSEVTRRTRRYIGTLPPNRLRKPNAFAAAGLPAYIEREDLDVPSVRVMRLVALAPES